MSVGLLTLVGMLPMASSAYNGAQPLTKRCVSGHQTEDPNSPPCQAYYDGDNGGATYPGVTGTEITVLVYQNSVITVDQNGSERSPRAGTYCDIDLLDCNGDGIPEDNPHVFLRVANAFSRYFNARWQTYNRHVHSYMYFAGTSGAPAVQRADAADNFARIHPFAVLDETSFGGFKSDYQDAMAQRGVMVFSSQTTTAQPRSFFQARAPYIWSFWPDAESRAAQYSAYVCAKVASTRVTGGQFAGQERRYALYTTGDPAYPGEQRVGQLVRAAVASCGVQIADRDVLTFPYSGYAIDTYGRRQYALGNALKMKLRRYNTILYAGGAETDTSKAADILGYSPEWIVSGDGSIDGNGFGQSQGQIAWSHAWAVSNQSQVGPLDQQQAYRAYKEAEPEGKDGQWTPAFYNDWFMLFDAIQLSGSTLTPGNADSGLHALLPYSSTYPTSPALYFDVGDYSFVKDANEGWWDPSGVDPYANVGCYRLVAGGIRHNTADWQNALSAGMGSNGSEKSATRDVCSGYSGITRIRTPLG